MIKRAPSLRMVLVALITSLGGSFHFGFQLVLTNPAGDAFKHFLNETLRSSNLSESAIDNIWSFVVAILFLGSLIGSFGIRIVADWIGRKRGLYVSISLGIFSGGMSVSAFFIPSFWLYVASRITMGISIALSLGLSALFLSEASPKECRGSIGMITGTCVQFGTVVGSILGMPQLLGTDNQWYLIYVSEMAMMAVFLVMLPFLPETPGFLSQRRQFSAAVKSVQFFYICDQSKAEIVLAEIKEEQNKSLKNYGMMDVVRKASLRSKAAIGMVVTFGMSFSGIAVINAYAFDILKDTGLSTLGASLGNVGIAIVSMVAIVIASFVVDRFGRRPLLLMSFGGILFTNFAVFSLMYTFDKYSYAALGYCLIAVICVFIIFFAIGPGPLSYFITAELVGQSARSAAQSWASVVQMLSRFALVTAYTPLKNQIQSFAYLILFVAPVAASIVYLYFKLPETKNKNAREVEEAMQRLPRFSNMFGSRRNQVQPLKEPIVIEETPSSLNLRL